ncbi:MAG: hypothetical protein Ta2D_09960 [Rickettsiales bacterium]|nr:MAG: hypothetical protein Ta2D_09960 [Rickettsiales bacterium]
MKMDFKHIKKEVITPYKKEWYFAIFLLLLYIVILLVRGARNTSNITKGIDNAMYIGNGVAINPNQLLASKTLLEEACWTRTHFQQGNFYAIDEINIYPLQLDQRDVNSDLIILSTKDGSSFFNYAILNDELNPKYKKNQKMLLPQQVNKVNTFEFKKTRIVDVNVNNYTIILKSLVPSDYFIGVPVFNENYILDGIVKQSSKGTNIKNATDRITGQIGMKKIFTINRTATVRSFLDKYKIKYFTVTPETQIDNDGDYDVRKSILNIFCILDKRIRE